MNPAQSGEVEAGSPQDCATSIWIGRNPDSTTSRSSSNRIYRVPPQRLSKLDAGSKGCAPSMTLEPPVGAGAGAAGWTFAICWSAAGAGV
jgi:hypothetical protein